MMPVRLLRRHPLPLSATHATAVPAAPALLAGHGWQQRQPGTAIASPAQRAADCHRGFCDDETPKWLARYPKRYFDFKAFRDAARNKKEALSKAEEREIRREYAKPPPEGWTVLTFLERIHFGDGAEELADLFERWEDFISMDSKDLRRLTEITAIQHRKLDKYMKLFNHGLWPRLDHEEMLRQFGGKPLEREGTPWTPQEDNNLVELAERYDVNFGDPWIYISWEAQRPTHEVRDRYIELVVKPLERQARCELAITKSSRPLLMHRKFRMIPTDLYIVPSEENFRVAEREFRLPKAFRKYRQPDIF